MKKITAIIGAALAVVLSACAQNKSQDNSSKETAVTPSRAIVVCFSATGTTKAEALLISRAEDTRLDDISPVEPYTPADLDWNNKQSRSSVEMADAKARPAIKPIDTNFSGYDVVYLGYPIWWDLAPRVVYTFLDTYDLKGKTIIPFATSGGSTITNSVKDLRKTYPALKFEDGRLLNDADQPAGTAWVKSLSAH